MPAEPILDAGSLHRMQQAFIWIGMVVEIGHNLNWWAACFPSANPCGGQYYVVLRTVQCLVRSMNLP